MITYLTKLDATEGFEQILDFLNTSVIQYALTVNPTIYVSYIKQFWSSVSIKKTNDVVRLQALIDRRKVIITEDIVRQALHLDDAESIDCFPNEEIFAELARMGGQPGMSSVLLWLRLLSASQQLMISAQVGDLSSHTTKCTSPALTQKVFSNMRRVGKGFSKVGTSLFEGMLVPQQGADGVTNVVADDVANVVIDDVADDVDDVDDVVAKDAAERTPPSPTHTTPPPPPQELLPSTSQDKIAQALKITKLKQRVRRLEKKNKLKVFGRMHLNRRKIAELDADEDVTLEEVVVVTEEPSELKEVIEVVTTAKLMTEVVNAAATTITVAPVTTATITAAPSATRKRKEIYHIDLEHVDKILSMHDDEPEPSELKEVIEVVTTAKLMTEVVNATATTITVAPVTTATITAAPSATRKRKEVAIRDPEETATPSTIVTEDEAYARELKAELNKNINWDDVIDQLKRKEKEDSAVLRYQALKKKPQTEAHARKNMMHFNSIVGFLEKSEKQLEEEASKALKRKSKSSEQQAVKKKKFDEEMILLVERRYPLTRFTLEQMLNNVRLEVEEESEVSLELLRFLKTYCCWYKLKLLDNAADSRLRLLEQSDVADDKMKK
nr:hypothetical protein [Tanacetum cinerariifolium]